MSSCDLASYLHIVFFQAPQVQDVFRSNTGGTLDIPTPNDVTTQIQNAVQTYAEPLPEDIQNELTKSLSENMAELLKPLVNDFFL